MQVWFQNRRQRDRLRNEKQQRLDDQPPIVMFVAPEQHAAYQMAAHPHAFPANAAGQLNPQLYPPGYPPGYPIATGHASAPLVPGGAHATALPPGTHHMGRPVSMAFPMPGPLGAAGAARMQYQQPQCAPPHAGSAASAPVDATFAALDGQLTTSQSASLSRFFSSLPRPSRSQIASLARAAGIDDATTAAWFEAARNKEAAAQAQHDP